MATVHTTSLQRPKKIVRYGKSTSRSTYNTAHVDAFMEDELNDSKLTVVQKEPTVTDSYAVDKPASKAYSLKPIRPRTKRQDTFDVPSSGDEITSLPKRASAPRPKSIPALVDDTSNGDAALAPWEKKKVESSTDHKLTKIASPSKRDVGASPEKQLKAELAFALRPISESTSPGKSVDIPQPLAKEADSATTSALAKLAARRRLVDGSAPSSAHELAQRQSTLSKRSDIESDGSMPTPRKRARTRPFPKIENEDVGMDEACSAHMFEDLGSDMASSFQVSTFDFPASDTVEDAQPGLRVASLRSAEGKRRGKLPSPSTRSTPGKGLSAPARLVGMLPFDTDSTDATSTRSPSASASRPSTPRTAPTPSRGTIVVTTPTKPSRSPETSVKASGAMTPKQAQLWNQLLPSDPIAPSPSTLRMKDLSLNSSRRAKGKASILASTPMKSKSYVPVNGRRRTRLVDRLKASAEESDDENESELEDADIQMSDTEQADSVIAATKEACIAATDVAEPVSRTSQPATQNAAVAEGGPKVTYARTRSYLPEDNIEEGLMFDLPSSIPQCSTATTRRSGHPIAASQRSTFDLGDSDEEAGNARLRTIHELRAAGRNIGFTQDASALLEDIANHNSSAKSRRRSALIELATKLVDRAYAERFLSQGFEHEIIAECDAASDDIADFILATIHVLLLAPEPPEHIVSKLRHNGVLTWLADLLSSDIEIGQLAKDRRNNMSKSAQGSLLDFCRTLRELPILWNDMLPQTLSSRLIVLKALDLLIGRLRRLGDKSELLDKQHLRAMMWRPEDITTSNAHEVSFVISILESLSTSTMALTWPSEVIKPFASSFPKIMETPGVPTQRHFLGLRLALNVTNENSTNCEYFGVADNVLHLLYSIEDGFARLKSPSSDEQRTIDMDLLVLAMVVMTNIAEHNDHARELCAKRGAQPRTSSLVAIFQKGQERTLEADSVEEAAFNIPFGYLAVMLANICRNDTARDLIASLLPDKTLRPLVAAVQEFIIYHQTVDMMSLDGDEAMEIRSGFTDRLKGVLQRLVRVAKIQDVIG